MDAVSIELVCVLHNYGIRVCGRSMHMYAHTDHKSASACLQIGMKNTCME